jgi:hypothetical protein
MFNLNNGNGGAVNGSVNGRGLHHRKLSHEQRVALAADVVIGEKPFAPSQAQYCSLFGITPAALRAELKVRVAANGNGSSDKVKHFVQTFVEGWIDLSEAERVQAFQAIDGPDIWKTLANFVA